MQTVSKKACADLCTFDETNGNQQLRKNAHNIVYFSKGFVTFCWFNLCQQLNLSKQNKQILQKFQITPKK